MRGTFFTAVPKDLCLGEEAFTLAVDSSGDVGLI